MRIDSNTRVFLGQTEIVQIKKGNDILWEKSQPVQDVYFYVKNEYAGQNTLTLTTMGKITPSSDYSNTVEYSKDKTNWTTITFDTTAPYTISMNQNEKVYFRNDNGKFNYYYLNQTSHYTKINCSFDFSVGGNINTLLDYTDPDNASLTTGCFYNLFNGATTLTSAYNLEFPATTVSTYCCETMFTGCSNLVSAPSLPATTLAQGCYEGMFSHCTSLEEAPELPATTLATYCYWYMFGGCSKLSYVKTYAQTIPSGSYATETWLDGVAPSGTFYNLGGAQYSKPSASGIPQGWYDFTDEGYLYIQNEYAGQNTISFNTAYFSIPSSSYYTNTVEYSKDKTNWSTITFDWSNPPTILMEQGEKVYLRNDNGKFNYMANGAYYFTSINCSQNYSVGGNINTLLDYTKNVVSLKSGCYYCLFRENSGVHTLTDVSNLALPAAELTYGCYSSMFEQCSSLTTTITLPATTLANYCYSGMFSGTGITSLPSLPATTLADWCYSGMFSNCTGLYTAIPSDYLPVTTLAEGCYSSMFYGCRNIYISNLNPLSLPATTLEDYCYNRMFEECRNIGTAPSLPATTLAECCYKDMFKYCTSLVSAPSLTATGMEMECYCGMFQGCTGLTAAPALPATTLAQGCYKGMFTSCSNLTSAPVLPATTLAQWCYESMFAYCTKLVNAPALPATTLANVCYEYMFEGCSKLETAPALPAKTLAPYCYYQMFESCTKLSSVTTYANNISAEKCIENWLFNVAASGTLHNYGDAVYTVDSASGIPTGWTEVKPDYFYIQNTYAGQNDITLETSESSLAPPANTHATSVEYSKDLTNWTTITFVTGSGNAQTITMNQGEKVYFRNSSGKFNYDSSANGSYRTSFKNSESCVVGGDVRTLIDYNNYQTVTLPSGCFYQLFSGNTELTDASALKLSSTTIPDHGYKMMFNANLSLTAAPDIEATSVGEFGCDWMFKSCVSLQTAPVLKSATLTWGCYERMFQGCSLLNSVTINANDISAEYCLLNWLDGVANSGTFNNNGKAVYTVDSSSGIPVGWTEVKPDYFYIENAGSGSNTLTLKATKTGSPDIADRIERLYYSFDKQTWNYIDWTGNAQTETITIPVGGKVYMRNDKGVFSTYKKIGNSTLAFYISMYCSDDFNAGGDTASLLDYGGGDTSLKEGCFYYLFYTNTNANKYKLKDVSNLKLNETTLAARCYYYMFYNAGITTPPSLPARVMAYSCYYGMFYGCTSLTTTPSLNNVTTLADSCFYQMFQGCTSLTTATSLPALTLAPSCYRAMFYGCTSLATAPSLPATTLADTCYRQMFYNAGITTPPSSLPATTLSDSCYYSMFQNCTSLTTTPTISATTLAPNCYYSMFYGCTGITTAPSLPITTLESNCYRQMFYGCTGLTTPPSSLPATTLEQYCYYQMFRGCTSLTTTPTISATTLAANCCQQMFYGCTGLTTAPELKADTLVWNCYNQMFYGCTSLNDATSYANDISDSNCLTNWMQNVSQTGTFHNLGSATYSRNASGIPSGWTEVTAEYFVFSNTVITNVGNNQARLTSDVQINYTGTWDDGYFEVYNVFDRDRSIHFSPSEISNGVLTASNLISESNIATLVSPATVTIYNSGTAVWTGSVSFTVVQ